MRRIANILRSITGKQERKRERKLPTVTRNPQTMIPDFYDSVPMILLVNTICKLVRTDDIDAVGGNIAPLVHTEQRIGSWTSEHDNDRKINVTYRPTGAYFTGGSLCIDMRIGFLYSSENEDFADVHMTYGTSKEATGVIVVTMSYDGTVPHWFEKCISVDVAELERDPSDEDSRPSCFLHPVAETALRIVYLKSKDRPGHAPYLIQRTPFDMLVEALQVMQEQNVECVTPLLDAGVYSIENLKKAIAVFSKLTNLPENKDVNRVA